VRPKFPRAHPCGTGFPRRTLPSVSTSANPGNWYAESAASEPALPGEVPLGYNQGQPDRPGDPRGHPYLRRRHIRATPWITHLSTVWLRRGSGECPASLRGVWLGIGGCEPGVLKAAELSPIGLGTGELAKGPAALELNALL
jgi:hypothetical protein